MIQTWNRPAVSQIAFTLLLGCCVTLILRPSELHPALQGVPIYEAIIGGTLLLGFNELRRQFVWKNLQQQPATMCVVGVLVAIAASHLSHNYLHGAMVGAFAFLKTVLFFAAIVALTDTVFRVRTLLAVIALAATVTVGLCVLDFFQVVDFEFIKHISDVGDISETNERLRVDRMCGTGIFHDPNDLSVLIVISSVCSAYFLLDKSLGPARFLWVVPLAIFLIGLLCTKSRGGLLSAGVGFITIVVCRYGIKAAVAAGLLGLCVLPLIAGRQANINFSEGGTGHERLTLWREGLIALRSPAILFGTGQGTYEDWAGLVAHNSFIHAYVEMGFFGGTMFVGCFFFPALSLWRLRHARWQFQHPEMTRLYPFMVAMLAGWTMGLQSLSRAYMVSTYLLLGAQVAYANLASAHLRPRRVLAMWDRPNLFRLLTCSAMVFVGFNVFVQVMAR